MKYLIDPSLKSYASERQAEYIDAVNKHGSQRKAAKALGVDQRNVERALKSVRGSAAARGYSPDHDYTRPVPDTHVAKGVSTYYDADGKVRAQWVKSSLDDSRLQEARQAAIEAMAEDLPRLPPSRAPAAACKSHLLNIYTLTDSHVGMLSWGKETGEPWDLKIAEETLTGCFEHMVANSPRASVALVNQLGDFLHSDGLLPVTPTSGHVLDQDGRFSKMVGTAIRILRRVIDFALARHDRVVVLLAEGNHDMAGSVWLRHMFKALYERDPRVEVIDSELPYYVYQHGAVMLAFHHGHLKKNDQLPLLFAAQFPKLWGETTKRYAHTGHRHHVEEKEHSGMTVHQHATLAARDAYAARGGWLSERQVTAITYHGRFGEVARTTATPEMLETTA
jgi:hypothetical protein